MKSDVKFRMLNAVLFGAGFKWSLLFIVSLLTLVTWSMANPDKMPKAKYEYLTANCTVVGENTVCTK